MKARAAVLCSVAVVATALVGVPSRALAAEPSTDEAPKREGASADGRATSFGAPNTYVLTGAIGLGGGGTWYDHTDASSLSLYLNPGFDYFIQRNFALGCAMELSYGDVIGFGADGSKSEFETSTFALEGRAGYNVELGDRASLLLQASFTSGATSHDARILNASANATGAGGLTRNAHDARFIAVSLFAPLLVHLAPHFFVGGGPALSHDLVHSLQNESRPDNLETTLSARFVVGGWL